MLDDAFGFPLENDIRQRNITKGIQFFFVTRQNLAQYNFVATSNYKKKVFFILSLGFETRLWKNLFDSPQCKQ